MAFAPLATCKPGIRNKAQIGDWVIGMGGARLKATGRCIFAMRVSEKITYNDYWVNPLYLDKRPVRNGSCRMMVGDNIYYFDPKIRRMNLQQYVEATLSRGVDSLWLGRDCGYRGGRRTGIALTDEVQLEALKGYVGFSGISKATVGTAVKERTATEVWKIIREVDARVFLWNVFPFHPFEAGHPMSNRRHTMREFNQCKDLLLGLLEWLRPRRILALGADAHRAVMRLGFTASLVRHPSYGGHIQFAATVRKIYTSAK
jgi:uracil-DNA glycosylase